jgi:hypothetical protein
LRDGEKERESKSDDGWRRRKEEIGWVIEEFKKHQGMLWELKRKRN